MVSASVLFVRGANMTTKQNLAKIADVVLMLLFCLAAVFVTFSAVLGPPSLWILARWTASRRGGLQTDSSWSYLV